MRTTITLSDELLRRAKREAAERRTTLSRLIADALSAYLDRVRSSADEPFKMITYHGPGGTLPDVDINDNSLLRDILDEGGGWTSST